MHGRRDVLLLRSKSRVIPQLHERLAHASFYHLYHTRPPWHYCGRSGWLKLSSFYEFKSRIQNDCSATETCCADAVTMPARPSLETHWYCLYTKRHQELQVSAVVNRQAIEVYFQLLSFRKRVPARLARQPLIPCYVSARMDLEQVGSGLVRWTPGLRDPVRGSDRPARVNPGIIHWIQEQVAEG